MAERPIRYKKAPIAEAILAVRFATEVDAVALTKAVAERLGESFGSTGQDRMWFEISVAADGQGVRTSVAHRLDARMLSSPDGHWRLTVGRGIVAMHALPPYDGWQSLRSMAETVLGHCLTARVGSPLAGVAVRYIDRVSLPPDSQLGDYFEVAPGWPAGLPGQASGFLTQIRSADEERGLEATLTLATGPQVKAGWPEVLYDLQVGFSSPQATVSAENWALLADELHEMQRTIFEQTITPRLRALLEPEW